MECCGRRPLLPVVVFILSSTLLFHLCQAAPRARNAESASLVSEPCPTCPRDCPEHLSGGEREAPSTRGQIPLLIGQQYESTLPIAEQSLVVDTPRYSQPSSQPAASQPEEPVSMDLPYYNQLPVSLASGSSPLRTLCYKRVTPLEETTLPAAHPSNYVHYSNQAYRSLPARPSESTYNYKIPTEQSGDNQIRPQIWRQSPRNPYNSWNPPSFQFRNFDHNPYTIPEYRRQLSSQNDWKCGSDVYNDLDDEDEAPLSKYNRRSSDSQMSRVSEQYDYRDEHYPDRSTFHTLNSPTNMYKNYRPYREKKPRDFTEESDSEEVKIIITKN